MNIRLILIIIAGVFAVITGLTVAGLISVSRARWIALVGAVVFTVGGGAAIYFFSTTISEAGFDGLSFALGAFGGMSACALAGALLANFLVSLGGRRARSMPSGL
ncbi:MAG TPA: hypothetical protein VGN32_12630 [Ktedonobacterales bacterium]|jgi:succinate dehydrogenase/fumarate reductase flavoprotein subunit|nr:hypothetical protein [Ktedonobacterales bacterium]